MTSFPPGVLTTLRLFEVVLYGVRLRRVTRWAISWFDDELDVMDDELKVPTYFETLPLGS